MKFNDDVLSCPHCESEVAGPWTEDDEYCCDVCDLYSTVLFDGQYFWLCPNEGGKPND